MNVQKLLFQAIRGNDLSEFKLQYNKIRLLIFKVIVCIQREITPNYLTKIDNTKIM